MKYLILKIHNFQKKCKNSFANCQNASQIVNCKGLIRTLTTVHNARNKAEKQTLPVTCIYRKVPKNGYQTATTIQTNLPPLEAMTKNIATKMAD